MTSDYRWTLDEAAAIRIPWPGSWGPVVDIFTKFCGWHTLEMKVFLWTNRWHIDHPHIPFAGLVNFWITRGTCVVNLVIWLAPSLFWDLFQPFNAMVVMLICQKCRVETLLHNIWRKFLFAATTDSKCEVYTWTVRLK